MAPARKDTITGDLFLVPEPVKPAPASQDYRPVVAGIVSQILSDASHLMDRHQIAAEMSRLTGRDVSKYMLDGYSSESREAYNLPFCLGPVLEAVTNSYRLTSWLAQVRGGRLLIGRETLTAELGRLEKLREDTATRIKSIKAQMGDRSE